MPENQLTMAIDNQSQQYEDWRDFTKGRTTANETEMNKMGSGAYYDKIINQTFNFDPGDNAEVTLKMPHMMSWNQPSVEQQSKRAVMDLVTGRKDSVEQEVEMNPIISLAKRKKNKMLKTIITFATVATIFKNPQDYERHN